MYHSSKQAYEIFQKIGFLLVLSDFSGPLDFDSIKAIFLEMKKICAKVLQSDTPSQ